MLKLNIDLMVKTVRRGTSKQKSSNNEFIFMPYSIAVDFCFDGEMNKALEASSFYWMKTSDSNSRLTSSARTARLSLRE